MGSASNISYEVEMFHIMYFFFVTAVSDFICLIVYNDNDNDSDSDSDDDDDDE